MTIHAGEPIVDIAYVEAVGGGPSTLPAVDVFSSAIYRRPDNTTGTPTIASTAVPGEYEVTIPTAIGQHGTWSFLGTSSETGDEYAQTWDVDPATGSAISGEAGIIFSDLRMQVASELGDHIRLTATAAGSVRTLEDSVNLVEATNGLLNTHGIVVSAAAAGNIGRIVRVAGNDPLTQTVTFIPDLPADTAVGDVMDLVNLGGYGFRPQLYDSNIRNAVTESYSDYVVEVSAVGEASFDADLATIDIPDDFVAVHSVYFQEDSTNDPILWRDVRPALYRGIWGQGWSVDVPNRKIMIDGSGWLASMAGTEYVIGGYARHAIPTAQTDVITVPVKWMVMHVKATMAMRKLTDRRWNDWAVEWGRKADIERGNIWVPRKPNTVWLVK